MSADTTIFDALDACLRLLDARTKAWDTSALDLDDSPGAYHAYVASCKALGVEPEVADYAGYVLKIDRCRDERGRFAVCPGMTPKPKRERKPKAPKVREVKPKVTPKKTPKTPKVAKETKPKTPKVVKEPKPPKPKKEPKARTPRRPLGPTVNLPPIPLLPHRNDAAIAASRQRIQAAMHTQAQANHAKAHAWPPDKYHQAHLLNNPHLVAPMSRIADRIQHYEPGKVKVAEIEAVGERYHEPEYAAQIERIKRELPAIEAEHDRLRHELSLAPTGKHTNTELLHLMAQEGAYSSAIGKYQTHLSELATAQFQARLAMRHDVAAILAVDHPLKVTLGNVQPGTMTTGIPRLLYQPSVSQQHEINQGKSFVEQICRTGTKQIDHVGIGSQSGIRSYYINQPGSPNDHIALSIHAQAHTVVHELGHVLDSQLHQHAPHDQLTYNAKDRSLEFLRHRVGNEQPVSMRDKFGDQYESHEMGRKDKFDEAFSEEDAYYIGKDYGKHATEILSMGMDKLYHDPVTFVKKDPEYAKFILGILDGSLR